MSLQVPLRTLTPVPGHGMLAKVVMGLALVLAAPDALQACAVPVFRYALERDSWHPAAYPVVLLHRGPLGQAEAATLQVLTEAGQADAPYPANIAVQTVDLAALPVPLEPRWQQLASAPLPRLIVYLPGNPQPVWTAAATPASARLLLDSPVRRQIQQKLADGHAAVWIVLESATASADNHVELVQQTTEAFADNFRFAPAAIEAMGLSAAEAPRLAFAVLRLKRNDPAETVLVNMLLHSEADLRDYADQTMAFPVFGRGRSLWALVGDGISVANIQSSCAYITGDCSCQIKAQNPGIDLLMSADWYKILAGVAPPAFDQARQPASSGATAAAPAAPASKTVLALLATAGVILLIVALGSLQLRRKTRNET